VRGSVDPAIALARHNCVSQPEGATDIPVWDDAQALAHHEGEAARLRARRKLERNKVG
jgi:hypothetical protein